MTETPPRRIVLFGINYWPEEIGIAPYTTGLAEYLAAAGWDATVVTGLPHYPAWDVPESFRGKGSMRERRNGVDIVRMWHHVPAKQTALKRGGYEITYALNGLRQLRLAKPDLAVGIVPSLGGGMLASLAAKRWRIPSAVVVQDLMANAAKQSGISGGGRVANVTGRVEGWVSRSTDAVMIVSESFRPTALQFGVPTERIVHLPNWTRIAASTRSRDETRAALGWAPDETIVLHAGNMGLEASARERGRDGQAGGARAAKGAVRADGRGQPTSRARATGGRVAELRVQGAMRHRGAAGRAGGGRCAPAQ